MEPSPFEPPVPPSPPPVPPPPPRLPPEPPPPPPLRSAGGAVVSSAVGAHPGGWAAVAGFGYGVLGVVLATGTLIAAVAASAVLGAGASALRNADASAADVAILERGADVIASPMFGLGAVSLLLGIAATVAGVGMLCRSERGRAALVVVLAASAVLCVGWCVYSITSYSVVLHEWAQEYTEARARLGLDADLGPALSRGGSSAVTDACVAGLHLAVIAGLVAALRSASARAWCGASDPSLSKQALERARLPR